MLGWRDATTTRLDHWTFLPLPATALLFDMVAREPDAITPDRSKTWWRCQKSRTARSCAGKSTCVSTFSNDIGLPRYTG